MKIRKATIKDSKKFTELAKRADRYPAYWSKSRFPNFIKNPEQMILLIGDKGKLIGFVGLMKKYLDKRVIKKLNLEKLSYIAWIAVLPDYRNKKIGSRLLKVCEKYTGSWKKKGIWLTCKKDVVPFYEKSKYKVKGYFIKKIGNKKFRKFILGRLLR